MKRIKLTRGKFALVDNEDFSEISMYKWQFDGRYASRRSNNKKIYMHRVIVGNETSKDTDHINRNKLDNRRNNLRICSRTTNNYNQPKRVDNKSGYKGISWHKTAGKWRVRVFHNGKETNLGHYRNIDDAVNVREHYVNNFV